MCDMWRVFPDHITNVITCFNGEKIPCSWKSHPENHWTKHTLGLLNIVLTLMDFPKKLLLLMDISTSMMSDYLFVSHRCKIHTLSNFKIRRSVIRSRLHASLRVTPKHACFATFPYRVRAPFVKLNSMTFPWKINGIPWPFLTKEK